MVRAHCERVHANAALQVWLIAANPRTITFFFLLLLLRLSFFFFSSPDR
jgi:hypothetical protein